MKLIITLMLLVVLASTMNSCKEEYTKGPRKAETISKLRNAAKLATVEYVVSKIILARQENWIAKDAQFFALTQARITAGIDFDKLREENVKIEGTKINISLPPIEIINFSYPADSFQIIDKYNLDPQWFARNKFDIEKKDEMFRQGELAIRESIKDLGITKSAQKNTVKLLTSLLQAAGYDEVYISFQDENGLVQTAQKVSDFVADKNDKTTKKE
jgi:hypothetical protein